MSSPTEQRLGEAFRDLVAVQPFTPDTSAIERVARQSRRRARLAQGGIGVGVVAVAAVVAVGATNAVQPTSAPQAGGAHPAKTTSPKPGPLVSLAADVAAEPAPTVGNATLVQRGNASDPTYGGWDLYTDDGHYYFAQIKSDLPEAVRRNEDQGGQVFAREIAAALYAVNGDLNTARLRMAEAPQDPGRAVPPGPQQFDNRVWDFGMDALIAGSSNPQVRAGVLRLYSTLPDVTITNTIEDGQPALNLTAGAPELLTGDQGTLTLNADTGVPLSFLLTEPNRPATDVTYKSTRVTVADVEAGKF